MDVGNDKVLFAGGFDDEFHCGEYRVGLLIVDGCHNGVLRRREVSDDIQLAKEEADVELKQDGYSGASTRRSDEWCMDSYGVDCEWGRSQDYPGNDGAQYLFEGFAVLVAPPREGRRTS
jgi:hypothetical protein